MMNDSAREIFYLLSFSVSTGFLFSKTVFTLINIWQEEKLSPKRYRP